MSILDEALQSLGISLKITTQTSISPYYRAFSDDFHQTIYLSHPSVSGLTIHHQSIIRFLLYRECLSLKNRSTLKSLSLSSLLTLLACLTTGRLVPTSLKRWLFSLILSGLLFPLLYIYLQRRYRLRHTFRACNVLHSKNFIESIVYYLAYLHTLQEKKINRLLVIEPTLDEQIKLLKSVCEGYNIPEGRNLYLYRQNVGG